MLYQLSYRGPCRPRGAMAVNNRDRGSLPSQNLRNVDRLIFSAALPCRVDEDLLKKRLVAVTGRPSARNANATASWRSGYAEDCKSLHPGSIPGEASKTIERLHGWRSVSLKFGEATGRRVRRVLLVQLGRPTCSAAEGASDIALSTRCDPLPSRAAVSFRCVAAVSVS